MLIPSLAEARNYLVQAQLLNPGPWAAHSIYTAEAARNIAACCPELDPEAAYVLGCLHDIGRRAGASHMRHVIDGYRFLQQEGHEDAARICLTHSFPDQNPASYFGERDCSPEDWQFLEDYIARAEYTAYDRLIQLCDALALPTGFCLVEKRMVDVALRYGTTPYTAGKWRAVFAIQHKFEEMMGRSIYSALPGVVENTFGLPRRVQGANG